MRIEDGAVRRRSTLRLSGEDIDAGYALACQTVVEGDVKVIVPPQEKIERRLTTDRTVAEVSVPLGYNFRVDQSLQRLALTLSPPSMDDQTDDLSRLQTALRGQTGYREIEVSLELLRCIGPRLRQDDWRVTAILDPGFEADGRACAPDRSSAGAYLFR